MDRYATQVHKKSGTLLILKYCPESMEKTLEYVRNKSLSLRQAAEKYQVPKITLKSKYLNLHSLSHGHPLL